MRIDLVTTAKQRKLFIDFPHKLYKEDPNYVPEIFLAMKDHLNSKKNPYFKHSDVALFLAFNQNDEVIGRIAATNNTEYNRFHKCNVGFFGFYDVIDDLEVSNALLSRAEEYCRDQGLQSILGPCNFSTNHTATLLIEGFDSPPVVQMTYNKRYFVKLLEESGYAKEMDFYAYWIDTDEVNVKALRLSQSISKRLKSRGISIRNLNKKDWNNEMSKIKSIYRAAWNKNWGFVPPTDAEFDFLANDLKLIVQSKYAFIAEKNGKPIGLAVALPNVNEITINISKGRLFPFGLFKLLKGKNNCKSLRIFLLGVLEEHRVQGVEALFIAEFIRNAKEDGLTGGEASWIVDTNIEMKKSAENLNGKPYKKYRIYSKALV